MAWIRVVPTEVDEIVAGPEIVWRLKQKDLLTDQIGLVKMGRHYPVSAGEVT